MCLCSWTASKRRGQVTAFTSGRNFKESVNKMFVKVHSEFSTCPDTTYVIEFNIFKYLFEPQTQIFTVLCVVTTWNPPNVLSTVIQSQLVTLHRLAPAWMKPPAAPKTDSKQKNILFTGTTAAASLTNEEKDSRRVSHLHISSSSLQILLQTFLNDLLQFGNEQKY